MNSGLALAATLAVFGALALLIATRRALDGHGWQAVGHAALGLLLIGGAALTWPVALHLGAYERLGFEQPVADLAFEQVGPQRYRTTLTRLPGGQMQVLELAGDEWQLEARVLEWRGWALALGLGARFRLERISGRFLDGGPTPESAQTVYALAEPRGRDLWALAQASGLWAGLIDAANASSTYLPMVDDARFRVTLARSGLVGQPLNEAAGQALSRRP